MLYGNLHVSITETSDSAGGKHFDLDLNSQGISGFGDYTGAVYQANGAAHLTLNYNAGGAANGTLPFDFQLVGQGSVPNQNVHALIHYTVNSDGTFTATTVDLSLVCK